MSKLARTAAAALALTSCYHHLDRRIGATPDTVDRAAPFLKLHLRDGRVYILSSWKADDEQRVVVGEGRLLDLERERVGEGSFRVPYGDVVLYETNTIVTSPNIAAIALVSGVVAGGVALGIYCAQGKNCFGSCPTFYAPTDDGRLVLQAEGFSDAIAPSLESHDIDALARTTGHGGALTLRMTNEAYETHVVKSAELLVIPRPPGGRVFSDGERLWAAASVRSPLACRDAAGSCLDAVRALDGRERTSTTDGEDLAARETIELELPALAGRRGLVIGARQSLLTTFLLYQGLSYLGANAGSWLAALERDGAARLGGRRLDQLVGGIEVQVERGGEWQTVGEVREIGPIATDVHLVMIPEDSGDHVRLRLAKGSWRIDYLALAALTTEATPRRIAPSRIRGTLGKRFAGARVPAVAFPIVTQPGDAYELVYELPPGEDYEVFLDSRGYYLEWMRRDWLGDPQPLAAARLLLDPAAALRELAPAFRRIEPDAEQAFWRSRYAEP